LGYAPVVIRQETQLSERECKKLCLEQALGHRRKYPSRLRSSYSLMGNRVGKFQVSLFMWGYVRLAGPLAQEAIQLEALFIAYQYYLRAQAVFCRTKPWKAIDINDGWSMARELRDGQAFIRRCSACGFHYFTSVLQYTRVDCPICINDQPSRWTQNWFE
jgi:hypothetical protein